MWHLLLTIFVILITTLSTQASCASGRIETGVNSSEQAKIVTKHNSLRLLLAHGGVPNQPKAVNIKRLRYDVKLAKAAQDIANTCVFAHVRVTNPRWTWVGQNLYISMSTASARGANWDSAIQSWFNEHNYYRYPDSPQSKTGHYTQLVWATTEYVGCGYTFFPSDGHYRYKKLYVCNYGPGGNIVGQAPYVTGKSGCESLC